MISLIQGIHSLLLIDVLCLAIVVYNRLAFTNNTINKSMKGGKYGF
jgi:hypothetical protein